MSIIEPGTAIVNELASNVEFGQHYPDKARLSIGSGKFCGHVHKVVCAGFHMLCCDPGRHFRLRSILYVEIPVGKKDRPQRCLKPFRFSHAE